MSNTKFAHWMTGFGMVSLLLGGLAIRNLMFGLSFFCLAAGFLFVMIAMMYYLKPEPVDEWEKDEYDHAAIKHNAKLRSERRAKARRRKFKVIK